MKEVFEPIIDRLAEEVGSRPRVSVYVILGLAFAFLVALVV